VDKSRCGKENRKCMFTARVAIFHNYFYNCYKFPNLIFLLLPKYLNTKKSNNKLLGVKQNKLGSHCPQKLKSLCRLTQIVLSCQRIFNLKVVSFHTVSLSLLVRMSETSINYCKKFISFYIPTRNETNVKKMFSTTSTPLS
jgi:hypothetical protein